MTGRVDIPWRILRKCKKVKIEVSGPENFSFWTISPKTVKTVLFWILWLKFFAFFSKMRQSKAALAVILSFMKFFVVPTYIGRKKSLSLPLRLKFTYSRLINQSYSFLTLPWIKSWEKNYRSLRPTQDLNI